MRDYNQEYKDNARQYAYGFDSVLRGYMMRSIQPFFRESRGRALEMGCFKGDMTELLAESFPDLTAMEASNELAEIVRGRFGNRVKVINTTFEDATVTEPFDHIFLTHTLEHLDDPPALLGKVRSWLSPRGRLFLVCPNANAPSRQIAVKMGLITHNAAVTPAEREHGHGVTYSLDTLERDARAGGLNVVFRGGIFFKPLANYQFDKLAKTDIISEQYLEGCYQLGMVYPDLCASIFLICER